MKLWLNCQSEDLVFTKKNYLLRAAKRLGLDWIVDYNKKDGNDPIEYVLNIEPYKFVKGKIWTGLWEIDIIRDRPELSQSDWISSDDVFLANYAVPERMKPFMSNTTLLFQACDPELHKPLNIEKEYDIAFAGSTGPGYFERNRVFDFLRWHVNLRVFGKEYKPEEYVKICNKSKVQFIKTCNTSVADSHLAQRFFELLAIGPVITNWDKDLIYTGLIDGEDFLSYKNDLEMLAKVKMLLACPEYAAKIAANGRKKALTMHTYEHRLMSIINQIKYGHN